MSTHWNSTLTSDQEAEQPRIQQSFNGTEWRYCMHPPRLIYQKRFAERHLSQIGSWSRFQIPGRSKHQANEAAWKCRTRETGGRSASSKAGSRTKYHKLFVTFSSPRAAKGEPLRFQVTRSLLRDLRSTICLYLRYAMPHSSGPEERLQTYIE